MAVNAGDTFILEFFKSTVVIKSELEVSLYFFPIDKHVQYFFHLGFSTDKIKIQRNQVLTLRIFFYAINIQFILWVALYIALRFPIPIFFYKRRATDLHAQLQKLQGPTPENPLKTIVQIVANKYLHPKKVYYDIFENKKSGFIKQGQGLVGLTVLDWLRFHATNTEMTSSFVVINMFTILVLHWLFYSVLHTNYKINKFDKDITLLDNFTYIR